jgi:HrpA-like RNA helicase
MVVIDREIKEKWWLCPLHSTVTFEEQLKVFKPAPPKHRKVILATNIAESSITVPDVKYGKDFKSYFLALIDHVFVYNF